MCQEKLNEKNQICDCYRYKQMPYTDQMILFYTCAPISDLPTYKSAIIWADKA